MVSVLDSGQLGIHGATYGELVERFKLNRILIPLDGEENSEGVLGFGALFASWFGSELLITHVVHTVKELRAARQKDTLYLDVDHDRGAELAQAYLDEVAQIMKAKKIKVSTGVSAGGVGSMILERLEASGAGMLIMKHPKTAQIKNLIYPNVLHRIWGLTAVPILIVGDEQSLKRGVPVQEPKYIYLAINDKDSLLACLPYVKLFSQASNAKTIIVFPLKRSVFSSNRKPPIERVELDLALKELEDSKMSVDVLFVNDILDVITVLKGIDQHSWVVTSSKFRSLLSRPTGNGLVSKLAKKNVSPLLVVPNVKVAQKRQVRIKQMRF